MSVCSTEVWPRFQSLLNRVLWTKDVERIKVLIALGPLCLRQCFVNTLFMVKVFLFPSYKGIGAGNLAQIKSPASELCNAQVCLDMMMNASTSMTAEKETVQWWRYGKIRTCLVPKIVACWWFGKYIYCTMLFWWKKGRKNCPETFTCLN